MKQVTVLWVNRDTAKQWAEGKSDQWLFDRQWHEGNCACVFDLLGKWAWRDMARIIRGRVPEIEQFTGFTVHPFIVRRFEECQAQITFQDERGPRYWLEGESLKKFLKQIRV